MRSIVIDDAVAAADAFGAFGDVVRMRGADIARADLSGVEAIVTRSVTRVDAELLGRAPDLRFVGTATAGVDHVDRAALDAAGVAFAHAPGSNAAAVVEWVLATIVNLAYVQGRKSLLDATVGIVGCGEVGGRLADVLTELGMSVRVNDPPREEAGHVVDHGWSSLEDVVASCDLVSLHVPLEDMGPHATRGLIDRGLRERVLRRNGVWINTCRGEVLSLDDMSAVGGGALALDVWPGEPELPWSLLDRGQYPQIAIASPHVAGYSLEGKLRATRAIMEAMGEALGVPAPRLSSAPPDEASFRSGRATLAALAPELERAVELERDDGYLRGLLALPPDRRAAAYRGLRRGYPLRRELGICDPE